MKRLVRHEQLRNIIFEDSIYIEVTIPFISEGRIAASSVIDLFPGLNQFKQDVLDVLEKEYGFDVIEDIYNGVKQKGGTSNRRGSISLYFDTYYNLSNAADPMKRVGITQIRLPDNAEECDVRCFIHIRFSNHNLSDGGYVDHNKWVSDNAAKYKANDLSVALVIDDERIEVDSTKLANKYNEALEDLRMDLDFRISSWVRKARFYVKVEE